jgi:hypothetical protein
MQAMGLIKRSGLQGIKRGNEMPMPNMMNSQVKEIQQIIKKRAQTFKPV